MCSPPLLALTSFVRPKIRIAQRRLKGPRLSPILYAALHLASSARTSTFPIRTSVREIADVNEPRHDATLNRHTALHDRRGVSRYAGRSGKAMDSAADIVPDFLDSFHAGFSAIHQRRIFAHHIRMPVSAGSYKIRSFSDILRERNEQKAARSKLLRDREERKRQQVEAEIKSIRWKRMS